MVLSLSFFYFLATFLNYPTKVYTNLCRYH